MRQSNSILTVNLPERCYALDVASTLLVVTTAERHILAYTTSNPSQVYKVLLLRRRRLNL